MRPYGRRPQGKTANLQSLTAEELESQKKRASVFIATQRIDHGKLRSANTPFSPEEKHSVPPKNRRQSGWKPIGLRWPFLLSIVLCCVALITALQVLYNKQGRDGAIHFAPTLNDFSTQATIGYLYLPTILSTLFGLAWAWIDLDAKRFEPYFQLSKSDGAKGDDTVFLDYATDFIALVPLRSLRRKHWPVFLAGLAMVFVFWALTPITGAIFNISTIQRIVSTDVSAASQIVPIDQQISRLNGNILNGAYAILWRNLSLPAFTTRDSALIPFKSLEDMSAIDPGNGTLTAPTTRYFTNMTCTPALPADDSGCSDSDTLDGAHYTIDNGHGCKMPVPVYTSTLNDNTTTLDYQSLVGVESTYLGCPCNSSNQFMVNFQRPVPGGPPRATRTVSIIGSTTSPMPVGPLNFQRDATYLSQITAAASNLFCSPKYWQQNVNATIKADTQAVLDIAPLEDAIPLPSTTFNATNFEYGLDVGPLSLDIPMIDNGILGTLNADIFDSWVTQQTFHASLRYPTVDFLETPMAAYAFTSNLQPFEAYNNAEALTDAWQSGRQLLFSLAIGDAMTPIQADSAVKGSYVSTQGAIVMNRTFTILAETFLSVILLLSLLLLIVAVCRTSRVERDPSSLAAVLGNVSGSLHEKVSLLQSGGLGKDDLIHTTNYRLDNKSQIEADQAHSQPTQASNPQAKSDHSPSLAYPLGLRMPEQGALLCVVLAVMIFLAVLRNGIVHSQGFVLNVSGDFTSQLILDYIPTVFSTSLEPVWVMFARDLAFLQPFDTLFKGRASGTRTLTATYTSCPPQFAVVSALSRKHLLLAIVAVNALLANVLNVAMGGLFQPRQISLQHPASFHQNQSAQITEDVLLGQLYGTDPNYSTLDYMLTLDGTYDSPPQSVPWVSNGTFYVPLLANGPTSDTDTSSATTTGVSVNLSCDTNGADIVWHNASSLSASTSIISEQGQSIACANSWQLRLQYLPSAASDHDSGDTALDGDAAGSALTPGVQYAAESFSQFETLDGSKDSCASIVLAAWLRANQAGPQQVLAFNESSNTPVTGTVLTCRSSFRTGLYDVQVDSAGHILQANQSTQPSDARPLSVNATVAEFYSQVPLNALTNTAGTQDWHNNTRTGTYLDHFVARANGNPSIADPQAPPPNPNEAGAVVADIVQRYFAIWMSMNLDHLNPLPDSAKQDVQGFTETSEQRMFFAPYVFEISITLLALDIVVVVLIILFRPKKLLPYKPTNIAAVVRMAAHSRLLDGLVKGTRTVEDIKKDKEQKYGYGHFVGTNGRVHEGIELWPLVTPIVKGSVRKRGRWRGVVDGIRGMRFGKRSGP